MATVDDFLAELGDLEEVEHKLPDAAPVESVAIISPEKLQDVAAPKQSSVPTSAVIISQPARKRKFEETEEVQQLRQYDQSAILSTIAADTHAINAHAPAPTFLDSVRAIQSTADPETLRKKTLRTGRGMVWEDSTLADWPESSYLFFFVLWKISIFWEFNRLISVFRRLSTVCRRSW